ncbi:MAG: Stk1 family PASTA domain-containing Ser/Thr kinase [Clostridia bacterium]|nr:Stk1 family PASTA domain-containing Ser/Thr kinase [Clostridia bacterium]
MTMGTVLSGRYVVEEIVGTGGMAVVYRAWDRMCKRIVAIKVLRPEYQQDVEFLRRFSREAEAASKVSHENIVGMYDVGMDGDTRYIVMEYVDGTTLKDMIRQMGHLGPDAVVRMGIRILAAVDHAHKNGIVHRDIKPQNILVDSQGIVKVADFGIARLKAQQTTRIADVNSSALGSVHYISPEQASGEVADEKSDLYSVGIVLYEMLLGHVPFDGDTAVSVALKHVSEQPHSMREEDKEISRALDEVVLRALSKKPADRYQTAAEMAADLRKALDNPDGGFVKQKKPENRSKPRKRSEPRTRKEIKVTDSRQRRTNIMRRIMYSLLGVLIACVLFLMVMGVWVINHMRMPDVVGMIAEQAYAELPDAFSVMVKQEYNNFVPKGSVIAQSPEAGNFVSKTGEVYITISSGPRDITISDYSGWMYDEAMSQLVAAGMENVDVVYVLSDLPIGTVVSQSPDAGIVPRDSQLILNVSGETVLAPNVFGYTLENASQYIESEGLTVGNVSQAYSADAAAGTVIAQSVAPKSEVVKGAVIDLTIAQSQETMYYPGSDFRVVSPLDNTKVDVTLTSPTGIITTAYSGVLSMGTHSIPLSSAESGVHRVAVYLDGVLLEEMQLTFE